MEAISSSRMAAIDENCEALGLKRLQLMENAGSGIAREIKKRFKTGKVLIIAGKGNNGGDAFVAARHLKDFDVKIVLLGKSKDIKTEEARHNWKILEKTAINLKEITDSTQLNIELLKDVDIIIDAIFGTGVKGKIREPEATAIELINKSKAFVISVDVPSGFSPDGKEFDKSVKADVTVTFHKTKIGFLSKESQIYTGEVKVVDIGIPKDAEEYVGIGDIKQFLKIRNTDSHKGDFGRILIIGGGMYSGAPGISGLAALRGGADIVTIATPKRVSNIIAGFSPNLIVHSVLGDIITEKNIPVLSELIKKHDVVVMGMGLGNSEETQKAVKKLLPLCEKLVLDADALFYGAIPEDHKNNIIITPHLGEMKRLSDSDIIKDKISFVKDFAKKYNITILLKGSIDIISDGTHIFKNRTGNPGMTVGGTGDLLAGLTAALFARSENAIDVACSSAYISGAAGDLAFEKYGYGLVATDVIEFIPEVMKIV